MTKFEDNLIKNKWQGLPHWECKHCPFDTLDENEAKFHPLICKNIQRNYDVKEKEPQAQDVRPTDPTERKPEKPRRSKRAESKSKDDA